MLAFLIVTFLFKHGAALPVDNSSAIAANETVAKVNAPVEYVPPTAVNTDPSANRSSFESVLLVPTDKTESDVVTSRQAVVTTTGRSANVTESIKLELSTVTAQNVSVAKNGSDTTDTGGASTLNLAIIPVLGGFLIITVVCIKCCNRVKADVVKDREYIEDGKPLFRVEPPESHPDYLSSVSSGYNPYPTFPSGYNPYSTYTPGYNPYSTVTTGYNPYNTVTTLMSNVSTASETKDMGTMVKPRDIRRSMRLLRPSSVPDPGLLAREGDRIVDVAEEVKRLKQDPCTVLKGSRTRQFTPSPRLTPASVHRSKRSPRPTLTSKMLPVHRSENVLGVSRGKSSPIVREAHRHILAPRRQPSRESATTEERESLLDSTQVADSGINTTVADSSTNTPAADSSTYTPVTDIGTNTPVADSKATTPVSDSTISTPVVDSSTNTPVVDPSINTPVPHSSTDMPVADSSSPTPVTDSGTNAPAADASVSAPATDSSPDTPSAQSSKPTSEAKNDSDELLVPDVGEESPSTSSAESSPERKKNASQRSSLKSSAKSRSRNVSFTDEVDRSTGENSKKKYPRENEERLPPPVQVEITRASTLKNTDAPRKFSLTKVQETDLLMSPAIRKLLAAEKVKPDAGKDAEQKVDSDPDKNEDAGDRVPNQSEICANGNSTNTPNGIPRSPQ